MSKGEEILKVENLHVSFKTYAGINQAVRGVSFSLDKGETLAIVGESGCGKTVTSKAIMQILPQQAAIGAESRIYLEGRNLLELSEKEMTQVRGKEISMIFQDPMTSLNPTMRIGKQIAESITNHSDISEKDAGKEALRMLEMVRIPNAKERLRQYPHEFSGGMRQRAMIALALACRPKILIADEPTTALDVTIQAQIMDLIRDLQKELNMGVILVTHDLGVVASVADKIQVMYAGEILERGTVDEIFYQPSHPYTLALLQSVPRLSTKNKDTLYSLKGTPPNLIDPPEGCPFAARCDYGMGICRKKDPDATVVSGTHSASCWLHDARADRKGLPDLFRLGGEQ